jgi:hypothetical protein
MLQWIGTRANAGPSVALAVPRTWVELRGLEENELDDNCGQPRYKKCG